MRAHGRTARIASMCERPWTPEPTIASSLASSRASSRVATAETAAVRMAVIADAFISARTCPVSPENSVTVPWWASSPRVGLSGKTQTVFSEYAAELPERWAGIRPMPLDSPGGNAIVRSGWKSSPRARASRMPAIASMQPSMSRSCSTSAWLRTRIAIS